MDNGDKHPTHSSDHESALTPAEFVATDEHTVDAIDFVPIAATGVRNHRRIPLLAVTLTIVVALSGLILWFLITASSLIIHTQPADADVAINGGFSFAFNNTHLLHPGTYQLQASARGYETLNQTLVVNDQGHQTLELTLAKLPGALAVTTTPAGASVTLNGEHKGVSPLTVTGVPAGTYQLTVDAPRYLPQEHSVDVAGMGQTTQVELNLQGAWGEVAFRTTPPGASISVAGRQSGTTPGSVEVLAAGEEISISLPGYKTWQQTVKVAIGEQLQWPEIKLQVADARVHVVSSPAGANITLNGEFQGKTPLEIDVQPDTEHQLRLFLPGYHNASQRFTLDSGAQHELTVNLKPRLGSLDIDSRPSGARLIIDGKDYGVTPRSVTLPARPWQLMLRKPGYTAVSRQVTPTPGVPQQVLVSLERGGVAGATLPGTISTPLGQTMKLFQPDGSFTMGASRREQGRRANEILREVKLKRPFYFSVMEVTNEQFRKFNSRHSSRHVNGNTLDYLSQPVVNLSWTQAARFCNWLSEQAQLTPFYVDKDGEITGMNTESTGYRLPTEAEWAWVARRRGDGSMAKFAWGSELPPPEKAANIADRRAASVAVHVLNTYRDDHLVSAPVGSYAANHHGIHDLGGNVSEWINDYYSITTALGQQSETDPLGPVSGQYRVVRGPSWRHGGITELRLSFRDYSDKPRDDLGFRIARYAQ